MEPSGAMEHIVMFLRSARNPSTSAGVICMALRWFTPWPMASVIRYLLLVLQERNPLSRTAAVKSSSAAHLLVATVSRHVHLGFVAWWPMATVDRHMDHPGRDLGSTPGAGRHRGQEALAAVIPIRPVGATRTGLLGSLLTWARVFASPRPRATPVRTTPRPPTSCALLPFRPPRVPHDAA